MEDILVGYGGDEQGCAAGSDDLFIVTVAQGGVAVAEVRRYADDGLSPAVGERRIDVVEMVL